MGDEYSIHLMEGSESIDQMILDTLNVKSNAHSVIDLPSEMEAALHIATTSLPSFDLDSSPPPSSPHHVLCRCGVESDGDREAINQRTVQCSICSNYTHTSCITLRFSDVIDKTFICHRHGSPHEFHNFITKLPGLRKQSFNTVSKRLL